MSRNLSAAVVATAFALFSCAPRNEVVTFARPVKLYRVESMRSFERNYPGVVGSEHVSNLAFKMSGQLIKLNVENGQTVL